LISNKLIGDLILCILLNLFYFQLFSLNFDRISTYFLTASFWEKLKRFNVDSICDKISGRKAG